LKPQLIDIERHRRRLKAVLAPEKALLDSDFVDRERTFVARQGQFLPGAFEIGGSKPGTAAKANTRPLPICRFL